MCLLLCELLLADRFIGIITCIDTNDTMLGDENTLKIGLQIRGRPKKQFFLLSSAYESQRRFNHLVAVCRRLA